MDNFTFGSNLLMKNNQWHIDNSVGKQLQSFWYSVDIRV
jgi:hypothetical protein